MDGGATWTLLDSTDNTLAAATPAPTTCSPQRPHRSATSAFKVVVDPEPTPNGEVIVYAALGRRQRRHLAELDTGQTWQKLSIDAGRTTPPTSSSTRTAATDAVSNPTGNLQILYAAFRGEGVFLSPNRGQALEPDDRRRSAPR